METSDAAVESSFGITSSATRTPSGSASRQISSALRNADARLLSPAWLRSDGVPRCTARTSNGIRRAICSAASGLADGLLTARAVGQRVGETVPPTGRSSSSPRSAHARWSASAPCRPATRRARRWPPRRGSRNGSGLRRARSSRTRTTRFQRDDRGSSRRSWYRCVLIPKRMIRLSGGKPLHLSTQGHCQDARMGECRGHDRRRGFVT